MRGGRSFPGGFGSKLLKFSAVPLVLLFTVAACGLFGGGSSGSSSTPAATTTVAVSGIADTAAAAKPSTEGGGFSYPPVVVGGDVVAYDTDGNEAGRGTTGTDGKYSLNLTKNKNYVIRIQKGNVVIKAVVAVKAAAITNANVNPTTTAIVLIIAKSLGVANLGEAGVTFTSLNTVDLAAAITTITGDSHFAALVANIVAAVTAGDTGHVDATLVVTVTLPVANTGTGASTGTGTSGSTGTGTGSSSGTGTGASTGTGTGSGTGTGASTGTGTGMGTGTGTGTSSTSGGGGGGGGGGGASTGTAIGIVTIGSLTGSVQDYDASGAPLTPASYTGTIAGTTLTIGTSGTPVTLSRNNLDAMIANPNASVAREPYISLNLASLPSVGGTGAVEVIFKDGVNSTLTSPGQGKILASAPFTYSAAGTITEAANASATVTVTNRHGVAVSGTVLNGASNTFGLTAGENATKAYHLDLYLGRVLQRTLGKTFDVGGSYNGTPLQNRFTAGNYYWRITFSGISINYAGSYVMAIDGVLLIQ